MNMEFVRKLTIPAEVKEMYPITAAMADCFEQRDIQLKKILSGRDDRLLLLIGPCSADRLDAVLDTVWTHTVTEGSAVRLTPEFQIFYGLAHLAYHFSHAVRGLPNSLLI